MTRMIMAAVAALAVLNAGRAWAATGTGRITYISSDRDHMMLDSSEMYAVAPEVDRSSIAVADRVKIRWEKRDGQNVITAIALAPLTTTAPG